MRYVSFRSGNRVYVDDATYEMPDDDMARRVLEAFRDAENGNDVRRLLARYNAHLEALLAGAHYETDEPPADSSDEDPVVEIRRG